MMRTRTETPLGTWRICWQLGVSALATSTTGTATSIALVVTSVACVVGADRAFLSLGQLVQQLADGGNSPAAQLEVTACPKCPAALSSWARLHPQLERSAVTTVVVSGVGGSTIPRRTVPVRCVPPGQTPAAVSWWSSGGRLAWHEPPTLGTSHGAVLAGVDLAPRRRGNERAITMQTTAGAWAVIGTLPARPLLSQHREENGALLVPWRAPFDRLCRGGTLLWRVVARDTLALTRALTEVDAALRRDLQLRPTDAPPWRVRRLDRFGTLVRGLVDRFSRWLMVVPLVVMVLAGAGIFSVQALESAARIDEFGVRRAVGASRTTLMGQLAVEAMIVSVVGVALATAGLWLAGLLEAGAVALWRAAAQGAGIALLMTTLGMLLPGVSALRAASIASLEGGNP
jgi:hypothetical protein